MFLRKFAKYVIDFVEEVVLREEPATKNIACVDFATNKIPNAFEIKRTNQIASSKVISFGGDKTPGKVVEVYRRCGSTDETPIKYPALPNVWFGDHQFQFAGKISNSIYCETKLQNSTPESIIWELSLREVGDWKRVATCKKAKFRTVIDEATWVDIAAETSVKFYLPRMDCWIDGPEFNQRRQNCELVSCNDQLYVLGGSCGRCLSSVEVIVKNRLPVLKNGKWKFIDSMQKSRTKFAAVSCHDMIYAIGGESGRNTKIQSQN